MSYIKVDGKSYTKCFYCLKVVPKTHCVKDHIIPISELEKKDCLKIKNSEYNLIKVCYRCNTLKSNKPLQDFIDSIQLERKNRN